MLSLLTGRGAVRRSILIFQSWSRCSALGSGVKFWSPAVADSPFARQAEAFAVIDTKVVLTVRNSDFLTNVDVSGRDNLHALRPADHQSPVRVAIVVREAGGPKKQRWRLLPARHDDAEILPVQIQVLLLFTGHCDKGSAEILDLFTSLDELPGTNRCFVSRDGVAVSGGDFEWTLREINLDVLAQVPPEPLLLPVVRQPGHVLAQPWQREKLLLGLGDVFCDNDMVQEDARDIVLPDASRSDVLGPVLAGIRPEVSLESIVRRARDISKRITQGGHGRGQQAHLSRHRHNWPVLQVLGVRDGRQTGSTLPWRMAFWVFVTGSEPRMGNYNMN